MGDVEIGEVVGLYGTRERTLVLPCGSVTVHASSDGVWLRGGTGVMSQLELRALVRALVEAQVFCEEQTKRSA